MRCSFSVVNPVAVAALLLTWFLHHCWQRVFNGKYKIFSDVYIQHSLIYAVWNFHLNWLTFLEAMTDVPVVHFLSGHSVVPSFCVILAITNKCTEYRCVDFRWAILHATCRPLLPWKIWNLIWDSPLKDFRFEGKWGFQNWDLTK